MIKGLILLLIFLSLILVEQDLNCCESENEVEGFLSGNWKAREDSANQLYQYEFNKGEGVFRVIKLKENDSLEKLNERQSTIKVIKTKKGFAIEHNYKFGIIGMEIKYLDARKLILVREDGKEKEFYRISE